MVNLLIFFVLTFIVVDASSSDSAVILNHKENKHDEKRVTKTTHVLRNSLKTEIPPRRVIEIETSSEVPSNNTFSGDFTIVKANRCPSAVAICTDNDPQTFQNGAIVSLLDNDPISLYIDYSGNFTKVVFHYYDGISTIKQREFLPPYSLGGNDRFENFAPVLYLQTPGIKEITVRGFIGWKAVATTTISFLILDGKSATPTQSPIDSPSTKCFQSNSELRSAIVAYLGNGYADKGYSKRLVKARYGEVIGSWCVDYVEDFSYVFSWYHPETNSQFFEGEADSFNEDISGWNTSAARNMSNMFATFDGTFNQSLNTWNVSGVKDMAAMFQNQKNFDQDLFNWDVSSVITMSGMFMYTPFNRDISMWDVRSLKTTVYMFSMNVVFNQDLSKWNVSGATDISGMFYFSKSFSQDLCDWGQLLQNNTTVDRMFGYSSCPDVTADSPDLSRSPPGPFCYTCG